MQEPPQKTVPNAETEQPDIPAALRGPRVLLRRLEPDDAPAVWEALEESRPRLAPWFPWLATIRSVEDERAVILQMRARWDRREDLTVGIFEAATGRYLGGSGLHRIAWDVGIFEIGYWLCTSAEGHGYATETVQVLTRFAFDRLRANRVVIYVDPRNSRSIRVPQRLGFVFEGTLRRIVRDIGARMADRHVFALIRDDFGGLPWRTGPAL